MKGIVITGNCALKTPLYKVDYIDASLKQTPFFSKNASGVLPPNSYFEHVGPACPVGKQADTSSVFLSLTLGIQSSNFSKKTTNRLHGPSGFWAIADFIA
ncbi:hypothetical protein [Flagellimonas myxillae]|uniref:hypothetical protein n=1 Tax=Flagellimonas myxillae TaxID=2942214 RepID=UPI00201F04D6|nr:hypothetical protein [Muricauda myxillae]MCL6267147.1 hypothetical protein [Muricauda myxillae]